MMHSRRNGFTLVESATVTAIAAIVAGTAIPSFQDELARRQLEGVAAQLETDLQYARSEAVARAESVRVSFAQDASGSCYVLHTGPKGGCSCDGSGRSACTPDAELVRSVHFAASQGVQVLSNSKSIVLDADKGTVTPTATMKVQSRVGKVHQVVNIMGRVRSCSPDGALPAMRRC